MPTDTALTPATEADLAGMPMASSVLRIALASTLAGVLFSDGLFWLSLAYVGRLLLAQSNAEWERPPDAGAAHA